METAIAKFRKHVKERFHERDGETNTELLSIREVMGSTYIP